MIGHIVGTFGEFLIQPACLKIINKSWACSVIAKTSHEVLIEPLTNASIALLARNSWNNINCNNIIYSIKHLSFSRITSFLYSNFPDRVALLSGAIGSVIGGQAAGILTDNIWINSIGSLTGSIVGDKLCSYCRS